MTFFNNRHTNKRQRLIGQTIESALGTELDIPAVEIFDKFLRDNQQVFLDLLFPQNIDDAEDGERLDAKEIASEVQEPASDDEPTEVKPLETSELSKTEVKSSKEESSLEEIAPFKPAEVSLDEITVDIPTIKKVQSYIKENNLTDIDADTFMRYAQSRHWTNADVAKTVDWRAAILALNERNAARPLVNNNASKVDPSQITVEPKKFDINLNPLAVPTFEDVVAHVLRHNLQLDQSDIDAFIDYYAKRDWKNKKGEPVNWVHKLINWETNKLKLEQNTQRPNEHSELILHSPVETEQNLLVMIDANYDRKQKTSSYAYLIFNAKTHTVIVEDARILSSIDNRNKINILAVIAAQRELANLKPKCVTIIIDNSYIQNTINMKLSTMVKYNFVNTMGNSYAHAKEWREVYDLKQNSGYKLDCRGCFESEVSFYNRCVGNLHRVQSSYLKEQQTQTFTTSNSPQPKVQPQKRTYTNNYNSNSRPRPQPAPKPTQEFLDKVEREPLPIGRPYK